METNRDLIYLRIEDGCGKADREFGHTNSYRHELARVAAVVAELCRQEGINSVNTDGSYQTDD